VRKVLAACAIKGVDVEIDPLIPFFGDERFTAISPLRRIPVLVDDQATICDSSVILQYLEERFPSPSLLPATPAARAKARWIEEYADTRIGDVIIWRLYYQAVVGRAVWGKEPDRELCARTLETDLPEVMDWLEALAPEDGFLLGALSIADLSVAPFFANLRWSRVELDAARWPKAAAWLARVETETPLGRLNAAAAGLMRTPIPQHRAVLADLGFTPSAETYATLTPRKGPLTV
jgi:glutathione S-transferase